VEVSGSLDALDRIQSQAFEIVLRGAADAFDLSQESPRTIARYDTASLVRPESINRTVIWPLRDE
jgi:hypothetical protein